MARTRTAVWSHRLPNILANHKNNPELLSAALSGFCRLIEVTPKKYYPTLQALIPCLNKHIQSTGNKIEAAERHALQSWIEKLSSGNAKSLVSGLQNLVKTSKPERLSWSPQIIVDRRLALLPHSESISVEKWLISILPRVYATNNQFAIYGAGEIGIKAINTFESIGLRPKFLIDQRADTISHIHDIEVKNIKDVNSNKIKLILIASFAYRNEILRDLNNRFPGLPVI